MKDFLVSYSEADHSWAIWIAWVLKGAGYTTILQAWDSRSSSSLSLEMREAVIETKRVIVVLSEDYDRSACSQAVWARIFGQNPAEGTLPLMSVRVRECELKELSPQTESIDLVG